MKIDWKSKNTKIIAGITAVIVIPILWNQGSTLINGAIMAWQASQPKTVEVSKPEQRMIYPTFETTGRINAKYQVDIIARIDGWLEKSYFQEGDKVKKGQKLYQIEPDQYALEARNAQARVNENRAVYKNSEINYKRAKALLKDDFVSQEYYDDAFYDRNKNRAALDASVASLNTAKLNLSYTNITSPMDGRIGKIEISEGNYVTPQSGVLTTIYSTDPIRVIFSLKSSTIIQIKKFMQEGKMKASKEAPIAVTLKLADGSMYNEEGSIEYVDNKIDETTGTVGLRAIFKNPNEILMPGDYVNVILTIKQKEKVLMVPQTATLSDVGTGYYVWVAKDGKAERRNITVQNNIDNNWIVEKGLSPDDDVIVKGIQEIHETGQPINAKQYQPEEDEQVTADAEAETPEKTSFITKIFTKIKHILKKLIGK